jgi:hypothetical protein
MCAVFWGACRMNKSLGLRLVLCALGLGLGACASMKNRPKEPRNGCIHREPASFKAPLAGCWEGRWISRRHENSSGRLRCEMTPTEPGVYRAGFLAQWHVFRTRYAVMIRTQSRGGGISFEGAHSLPAIFGGEYRYQGVVRGDRMDALYDSRYDSGVLELRRVVADSKVGGSANPGSASRSDGATPRGD